MKLKLAFEPVIFKLYVFLKKKPITFFQHLLHNSLLPFYVISILPINPLIHCRQTLHETTRVLSNPYSGFEIKIVFMIEITLKSTSLSFANALNTFRKCNRSCKRQVMKGSLQSAMSSLWYLLIDKQQLRELLC